MTVVDVGCFRLVDPPDGQEAIIRVAVAAIDFPWERLAVPLARDDDGAIVVEWGDTGQSTSGLAYGYSLRMMLSNRLYHLGAEVGFVFAHEVGHLIDSATLRDEDRAALIELTHASPKTHRYDGIEQNGGEHGWSHNQPHDDVDWTNPDSYLFRHNEAFADLFVEAFAPTIWDGSFYPDAPARGPDWLRFVHTTDDLEAVRELVLWTPPEPEPVMTRGRNIDHAIADLNAWLKAHPKASWKRTKVLAARAALRALPTR